MNDFEYKTIQTVEKSQNILQSFANNQNDINQLISQDSEQSQRIRDKMAQID